MAIDFTKIEQEKVKKFVRDYGLSELSGFTHMKPVCYDPSAANTYKKHFKSFFIKQSVDKVWETYTTIHPKEAWNGEMVSFGLQYSLKKNSINYLNEPYAGMEKGQIILLNLRIFGGLLNIAVAHEIAEVSEQERLIKLCYMEGGASEGSQWITLHETAEGFTEVKHLTLYKSKSNFRDTILYPPLHTKAITEFHLNVKKKAEQVI